MNLYFDNKDAGKVLIGNGIHYTYRDGRFYGTGAFMDGYSESVVLSGYWMKASDGTYMLQITDGKYIDAYSGDWRESGQMKQYSKSDAQKYVNMMIENNKKIISCNLVCARFAYKLSDSEKQQLYALQSRLEERNYRLINDGLVSGLTTSTPSGYSSLESYLTRFMQSGGVGIVISTTAAIVITAIVVASLSTAAYFAYKYLFEQSAEDVKFSKQLTETLMAKLTPEEYQALMNETQGIVTKTKIKQMLSTSSSLVTWLLAGLGGYLVYNMFTKGGKE